VIDDPRKCGFDPGVLQCKAGDAADCLTAPQVETARGLYRGPVDAEGQVDFIPASCPALRRWPAPGTCG
jgi:hypothetical protein